MRFPTLVPEWVCSTLIKLEIDSEAINEEGGPAETITVEAMANWQDGGETTYTADSKQINITGKAYFNGDILPQLTNITGGYGYIFGEKREIYKGFKRRNPDGTVNHTEVQFK